jgi:hypothetical protein
MSTPKKKPTAAAAPTKKTAKKGRTCGTERTATPPPEKFGPSFRELADRALVKLVTNWGIRLAGESQAEALGAEDEWSSGASAAYHDAIRVVALERATRRTEIFHSRMTGYRDGLTERKASSTIADAIKAPKP